MKCLIVEDDPALAAQLAQAMRDGGFACDIAHDGTGASFWAPPKAMIWRCWIFGLSPACPALRC